MNDDWSTIHEKSLYSNGEVPPGSVGLEPDSASNVERSTWTGGSEDHPWNTGSSSMAPETDIEKMKVDELRQLAEERGVDHEGMKKADLVKALS